MSERRDLNHPTGDSNVAAAWHLEESGDFIDWSGNGYTLIRVPTITRSDPDVLNNGSITWDFGYKQTFDGVAAYAQNNTASMDPLKLQTLTIEAVVRWPSTVAPHSTSMICSMAPIGSNGVGAGYRLHWNGIGADFQTGNGGGFWVDMIPVVGTPPLATDTWHYVAATVTNGDWKLFHDGVQVGASSSTITISYAPVGGGDYDAIIIGASKILAGTKEYFAHGEIADVRISNRVRTPAEIAEMQEWLFPTYTPSPTVAGGGAAFASYEFPYSRYKTLRAVGNKLNHLVLGP